MRGCACGYTCGTPAALQRHLERQVTTACVEVDQAALTTAVDEGIARAIRTVYDDDDILKFIGKDGVADAWLAKNAAKMREGVTKDEVLKMMIGRATRDGHAPVASQLLRFIRSLHRKEGDALSGANVVSSVLNWAAMGSCGTHGPAMIAMLVVDGVIVDFMDRLIVKAFKMAKYDQKSTLKAKHCKGAVNNMLRGELARLALVEGEKALTKYGNA